MFMCRYASFPVKRKRFYRKSELQMFLLISGGHIGGPTQYTNMASPYNALQRCINVSTNNSETVGHKDLRLGQIVYNISLSWLLPLDGFQCIILLHDSEENLSRVYKNIRILNSNKDLPTEILCAS